MSVQDAHYMARAIRLAERGALSCSPNPRVGCVLVKDQHIVGEGWHKKVGEAHAEVNAIAAAGSAAQGATAYVSLEPCNHQGRTGPCSQALLQAGVTRVVYAASDHGAASSGGAEALRQAGVVVEQGLLENEALALNPGFHRRAAGGLPWLRMKLAMSMDGRAALPSGESQWITGAAAREDGHRWRARSDALVTGIGTVLSDDPQMTARLDAEVNQPLKVVVDRQARTPLDAKLRNNGHYLIAHDASLPAREDGLRIALDAGDLSLRDLLQQLGRRGCNEVMVEAGPKLSGAFLNAGLVDELILYQAHSL
ncbi:MAG: bifunctional diaminohydroxyphosphoribosylaminopyrimidine deaminase/5-amino-6-(5-phosphoribosylamino)uracil reductase RibD, partial [Oceanococcus sp.]